MLVGNRPWEDERGLVECPDCAKPHFVDDANYDRFFADYFEGQVLSCSGCARVYDAFAGLNTANARGIQSSHGWLPLPGALATTTERVFHPGETVELVYGSLGVANEATILQVIIDPTERAGCTPLDAEQFIANERFRVSGLNSDRLTLVAAARNGIAPKPTNHRIYVASIRLPPDDYALRSLLAAYRVFDARVFLQDVVVPANTAAEAALSVACKEGLLAAKLADDKDVKTVSSGSGNYFMRLTFLLPLVASKLGYAELPREVRDTLNELRETRNSLAHRGARLVDQKGALVEVPVTDVDAARWLAAATIGYAYARYFAWKLAARP